jgi:hypothetical protein
VHAWHVSGSFWCFLDAAEQGASQHVTALAKVGWIRTQIQLAADSGCRNRCRGGCNSIASCTLLELKVGAKLAAWVAATVYLNVERGQQQEAFPRLGPGPGCGKADDVTKWPEH